MAMMVTTLVTHVRTDGQILLCPAHFSPSQCTIKGLRSHEMLHTITRVDRLMMNVQTGQLSRIRGWSPLRVLWKKKKKSACSADGRIACPEGIRMCISGAPRNVAFPEESVPSGRLSLRVAGARERARSARSMPAACRSGETLGKAGRTPTRPPSTLDAFEHASRLSAQQRWVALVKGKK